MIKWVRGILLRVVSVLKSNYDEEIMSLESVIDLLNQEIDLLVTTRDILIDLLEQKGYLVAMSGSRMLRGESNKRLNRILKFLKDYKHWMSRK